MSKIDTNVQNRHKCPKSTQMSKIDTNVLQQKKNNLAISINNNFVHLTYTILRCMKIKQLLALLSLMFLRIKVSIQTTGTYYFLKKYNGIRLNRLDDSIVQDKSYEWQTLMVP